MNFGDPLQLPIVLVACGLGLVAAGLLNVLLPRQWRGADGVIVLVSAFIAILVAAARIRQCARRCGRRDRPDGDRSPGRAFP